MYNESYIPEYQGNPIIEALPKIKDDLTLIKEFKSRQACDPKERELPSHIRRKFLPRINNFIEPSSCYLEIFRGVEDALLESYIPKNPLSPSTQHWLHYLDYDEMPIGPSSGRFRSRGTALTLVGASGVGKTSMLMRILEQYPQIITHSNYKGKQLNIDQVVWLKIDCPENLNVSGLLTAIQSELDRLTGSDEATKSLRNRDVIAKARDSIERKFRFHFVGLLIIEEIQNININDDRLKSIFMQFLLNLINRTGVPILFVGNPEFVQTFKKTLKLARRTESGGVFTMDGLTSEEWTLFVKHLWKYQWTNPVTPFTDELSNTLYKLSTGIPDFAVRTFRKAQELVLATNDEHISVAVLKEAFERACALSATALAQRRNYIESKIKPVIPDVYISEEWSEFLPDKNLENNNKAPEATPKKLASSLIPDLNRVHHPEFTQQIARLRNEFSCKNPIDIEVDTIQKSAVAKNPIASLMAENILLRNSILLKL